MNIQSILDYQALDLQKVKLNRELAKRDEYVQWQHAHEAMNQSVEKVAKMNTRAAQLFAKVDMLMEQFNAASKEFDEVAGEIDGLGEDLKRAEFYEKTLGKLESLMEQIEKEAAAAENELHALGKEGAAEINAANKNASLALSYKNKVNEIKAGMSGQIEQIGAKQKELEERIDPKLLNIYRNARKQIKHFPVIVALREGKLCGCGIELSGAELGKLKDGEPFVTCPTCGRLVYKPEQ